MKRRSLLKATAGVPALALGLVGHAHGAPALPTPRGNAPFVRVRPGDVQWPSVDRWASLYAAVQGRLTKLASHFSPCAKPESAACGAALATLRNTFAIGDQAALTQTSGWVDAWTSQPSAYVVAAKQAGDVVAAVNFARENRLRLVVKGGGHSYQGTSDARDSLLVWTRSMNQVTLHTEFVAQGCAGDRPQHAVSIGAGAMWADAYHAVTTQAGRYVQGGGCTTVGVAGLVQSGGFSNFSKRFGTAAAGLIEAEIVTADGQLRIANACNEPDLFWALKGGGGGSFGIVTRVTLRTRELPATLGAVFFTVKAASDAAYRTLIAKMLSFYASELFNPHWGEQIAFNTGNSVDVSMVFQGLGKAQVSTLWAPLLAWLHSDPAYSFDKPFDVLALPAKHFWDPHFLNRLAPDIMVSDRRPSAPAHHAFWKGDLGEAGWFISGYKSAWLPATLLSPQRQAQLSDAIFNCTRHWRVGLHFNKGLAGAPKAEILAARDTAMNPAVLGAFALAIIAGGDGPHYPGMPDAALDLSAARARSRKIELAMRELLTVASQAGSYVSESDYFLKNWATAFWGSNHTRLAVIKKKFDPDGLFFVHHGIGSEQWSADGFERRE